MRSATRTVAVYFLAGLLVGCSEETKSPPAGSPAADTAAAPAAGTPVPETITVTEEELTAASTLAERGWHLAPDRELSPDSAVTGLISPFTQLKDGIPADDLKLIAALRNLKDINLSGVPLDEAALKVIASFPLKNFQVTYSKFPADGVKLLLGMTKLESLAIIATDLTDEEIEILAKLTTVRRVNLTGTKVTDRGIKAVAQMPLLADISLPQGATDAALRDLAAAKNLKSLGINLKTGRPPGITDAGLADFRKAHPQCRID